MGRARLQRPMVPMIMSTQARSCSSVCRIMLLTLRTELPPSWPRCFVRRLTTTSGATTIATCEFYLSLVSIAFLARRKLCARMHLSQDALLPLLTPRHEL